MADNVPVAWQICPSCHIWGFLRRNHYFSYWSGAPCDALGVYVRDRRVLLVFPTNDGLFSIFIGWPIEEFHQMRPDIEGNFNKALRLVPEVAERVSVSRREERFYGTGDLPNFFRKPYGPGWALVGDAGHHKDPYLALGVADAFRDAELLANAVDEGLSGTHPLDAALAGYEQRRNEMAMPDYRLNLQMAQFTPMPPEARQLRLALRDNQDQEDINRFFMARNGLIPYERFFNPENMQRIVAKSERGFRPTPVEMSG